MEKLVMERRTYDNKYLHRDFHATLDIGMAYVGEHFGDAQVDAYLAQYVKTRYTPMTLEQLEAYFQKVYQAEEAQQWLHTQLKEGTLSVKIDRCPGLDYLNAHGGASPWYYKTTSVLYGELAKLCGFEFQMGQYDPATGETDFVFVEKEACK